MTATCFRCDWEGETDGTACPRCGAPLYRPVPGERERRAAPPPTPAMVVVPVEGPAAPPPNEAGPARSSPRSILLIAGAVFAVLAFLLAQGDLEPGPPPGPARAIPRETGGRLVYTVPVGDGMARLWRWNLSTDQVSKGPLVRAPLALINVRSATYGWLGITSDGGGGIREASLLDSFEPSAASESIGSGDIVTWTRRGETVLLVERGPLLDRCRRRVDVTAVNVGQPGRESILHDIICGDILSVGRTSIGYFLTVLGPEDVNVVGVGYEDAGILLRDHGVIDVTPGGQMLVTPATEFVPEQRSEDAVDEPPLRVSGEASRYRLFGGLPVDLLADAAPLRIERVLAYGDGGTRALVIGRQGPDRRALWELPLGISGSEPAIPRYVIEARGSTAAAYAIDGTAFVLTDSRLWHLRDHRLTALDVPEGAPRPDGPLAWIVREPITEL
jgi:hypothetical protein